MKKKIIIIVIVALNVSKGYTRNVGIGILSPHASAGLKVASTNSGILIPRMNSSQRTGIATPAQGLLIYDTDTNTFWFYNATAWTNLSISAGSGWSLIPQLVEFAKEKDEIKESTSEKIVPDAVQYSLLSVLLLKEVQKHEEIISIQQQMIDIQQKQILLSEKNNNELQVRLHKLEKLVEENL